MSEFWQRCNSLVPKKCMDDNKNFGKDVVVSLVSKKYMNVRIFGKDVIVKSKKFMDNVRILAKM
jgi:hypothetical protein